MIVRATDKVADWLVHALDAKVQLRFGVWLVLGSLPIYAYAPFSGEPIVIYLMSAAALTLTGIGMVLSAEVLVKQEDAEDDEDEAPA